MGGGASGSSGEPWRGEEMKREYLSQLKKPIDGSDCQEDPLLLKTELKKLRMLCHSMDPSLAEEYFRQHQDKERERDKDKEGDRGRECNSSLVDLLKEKLENRLVSLQEAFQKIDTTNTGFITREEFIQACWYWGIQLEESDFSYLTTIIGPANQRIQYKEFLTIMTTILDHKGVIIGQQESHQHSTLTSIPIATLTKSLSSSSSSSAPSSALLTADLLRSRVLDTGLTMKQAFLKFDVNGSGSIEKEEMKQVLQLFQIPFSNAELDDLFVKFDVNRDHRFQYGEFVRIIQSRT